MARPPSWLPRLPEIRKSVEGGMREQFDSEAIKDVFHIQLQQSRNLMNLMPQVMAPGRVRLVERGDLVEFLETVRQAGDVNDLFKKLKKKKRVKRSIRVRVGPGGELLVPYGPHPAGVSMTLTKGGLNVTWRTMRECMEVMFNIAAMIQNDEEGFERDYCFPEPEAPAAPAARKRFPAPLIRTLEQEAEFDAWIAARRGGSSSGTSAVTPTGLDVSPCNPAT